MNTPLPRHLPAQSGAITGQIMTEDEIERMDRKARLDDWRSYVRRRLPALIEAETIKLPKVIGHSRHLH